MRFRLDPRALAAAALLVAAPACAGAASAAASAANDGGGPTRAEIDAALARTKADPALANERDVRTLRWKTRDTAEETLRRPTAGDLPGWLRWIGDFFSWLAQISRLLMWIVIVTLIVLLAFAIARFAVKRGSAPRVPRFFAPTHVRDLDIRPESLPDDVGAAARALWDRGQHRAALALLYRGLLSRLAHVHGARIRDSSTEGDCLALAAPLLAAASLAYATRLVRVWQHAIYGGGSVDDALVHELCAGFAPNLDARAEAPAAPLGATA